MPTLNTSIQIYSPLCSHTTSSHNSWERTSGRGNSGAYKGYYPSTQWVRSGL